MSQPKTKLQVWWHLRDPKNPASFAISYLPCNAETGAGLEHAQPHAVEGIGNELPQELRDRLLHCARQLEPLIPPRETRDFGLGQIVPQSWLEAFSYFPQGGPNYDRGDLFVAYRYRWGAFTEEPYSRVVKPEKIPKSLEAMLRTFTPVVEELCWHRYRERYRIPAGVFVPQEYRPSSLFLSFLDPYRHIAIRLRDSLVAKGFMVFVDREAIAIGKQWRLELEAALEEMNFFIPLLAPGYAEAGETLREQKRAVERKELGQVVILPILVQGAPHEFPAFNHAQMLLLREQDGREDPMIWIQAVERLVGGIFDIAVPGVTG